MSLIHVIPFLFFVSYLVIFMGGNTNEITSFFSYFQLAMLIMLYLNPKHSWYNIVSKNYFLTYDEALE